MIFAALLALQGYSPETNAVMDRARREAAAARAAEAKPTTPPKLPMLVEVAKKFQACLDAANTDPDAGIRFANSWRLDGGAFHARQCLGCSYAKAERWAPAMVSFEQAADEAERAGDVPSGARLWAQAGNAALASGDAAKARSYFDAAIARGLPPGAEKGEAYLDRARTFVSLGDLAAARSDLDVALDEVPRDPLAWLLSATLARRAGQMDLAQSHVARAVQMSPDDASVALEEGNIAILTNHADVAQSAWQRAVRLSAQSNAGRAAADNLSRLGASAPAAEKTPR
ncbi:hypothetical protein C1T17_00195 [Sphingobium sp. SCG-1]|uniref:tetratricopeptide repeat protein n=1 Tax=Sphingobium sp. SCG-1 TaxID=2072936 RepID=UPI000CD6A8C7|nr:tetratricopeptide repeat protein [Sphingobium sp. SCG-1]AUW56735.1 hypothetical protein C1T17_00195 [Sphingobium sp. SCG-1]